ncbi:TPA: restriction endonuclease subunit S [Staphylococcus aureus]|uniref:restriction endonuclease subunit S n=1 Tax=Staphylococcus aureus TaxID=1280 RepID=UPI0002477B56|nr:restriction endonuclease subunit S [Staphylococcus aureus]AMO52680.1 Type I restriction-modification system, specificity subunit S [Staphylococcus aureus subsp. aureus Tager 104]EHO92010.1 type I restriction modification DNA specificity domain protein [Staphylococcus aureus subsp. aureus 21262]MBH4785538.1 restriction endonuclease subunit S [Staphylococcus aureus]MBH4804347.1 restriction endonuclease subunit S [Staphylococcus aureus]MBH4811957.1 restriction endonuclease subunit S [Staphyloc
MSNTQKKNVPELRFPGFEGEWEEKKLEDIIKVNSGKDYKHLDKGDIPVYGTGGYMTSVSEPLSEIDAVGIGRKGTINKPYLLEAPFWTVDTLFYCTPKKETDILFILSLFRKINWKVYDESTGVPSLSKQTINKINRFVPTNKEQQKIGKFFSKLDRQIELEEQKIELLQQQKKGYIQKIFSQELRFKDENGDDYPEWEETTIQEIAQINTGKKDTKDAITNGSYDFYVRSPIVYKINTFSYEGEAILTVGDGVGVGKVFHYVNGKFDYHQRVYKISDFKNYYGLLLFYYFSQNFLKETKKYSAKTSVDSVRKDMVANMKVPRPIYIEQEKIGQFIKKVDNKIKIQKQVIELLKQRKKALLQKMFI